MKSESVKIVESIFNANDQIAMENKQILDKAGVFSVNMMASPGSGKTSLILKTIEALADKIRIGVIEGDTAPVTIDSDKIKEAGMPAIQVNTGGNCHMDAPQVNLGLSELPLDDIDLLIVENVGNLVCPAGFKLGTDANIVVASVPEGDDKPYKYPNIYRGLDVIIINKTDVLPYFDFDMDYFKKGLELLNPGLTSFPLSCKTGEGVEDWANWLLKKIEEKKSQN